MTKGLAACFDKGCHQNQKCLRYLSRESLTWQIHAWSRGAEDSCEYFLPVQQHELSSTGQDSPKDVGDVG